MTETRWLTDDQQRAWRKLAAVIIKLPAALESQLQREAGISHFEYWVLALLSEAPDRTLRLGVLAAQANASLSRLSHVVTRLENRAWVRRRPCPDNGRSILAVLTDAGYEKVIASAPGHVEAVQSMVFDRLGVEQLADLATVCDAILSGVEAAPGA